MNLEIQQLLTHALGFIILLWILKRLAWRPLLTLLEERKERIASEFRNIENSKAELARLEGEYRAKLAEIDTQARAKIQEAINEGQRMSMEIQEKARDEARKIIEKAKMNIDLEVARARMELKNEMANLAIRAAEKILQEEIDEEKHKRLVMNFLEEVEHIR